MKKRHIIPIGQLSLLLVLLSGLPLFGQTQVNKSNQDIDFFSMSFEELLNVKVETVTKTIEKISLSPAIISVISAADINNYGYLSVAEALSHVTGFVDNYDLATHNFGVRGINSGARSGSRTIKFMLDGQAIAFRSTSQNFIDQDLIPMDMIERIEIVRGPVSALYGANAFLGVVNIVTKTGEKLANEGGEIAIQISRINNAGNGYGVAASYGNKPADWDYSFGFSQSEKDRAGIKLPRRSPAYEVIGTQQSFSDDTAPMSFYARSKYTINERSALKMRGFYQRVDVENPFSDINALQNNGTTRIALDNLFFRNDYDIDFTDKIHGHVFAAYSQGATLADDKIEVGAESFYLTRRFGYTGLDIGSEVFFSFRENDSLLLGLDAKRDQQKIETFTRIDRTSGEATVLNPARNEELTDTGLYFQYLIQLADNWRGIAGFRTDNDSVIGKQSSSRVGVVGQFESDLILKVLAGSSFQAPSAELLYRTAVQSGDIIGNPDLAAQKAKTFEISMAMPVGDVTHLSATYFKTKVDDLVVFESDASNLFASNSSGSTTEGIELEWRLFWNGIDAYMNYSRQKTRREKNPLSLFVLEYQDSGEIYPEQAANFGFNYYWELANTRLSLNNSWVGKRQASSLNVLYINQFYQLDSYMDTSLTISTDQFSLLDNKKATLRFQVKDLFDNNYVNPGFGGIEFPSLGRQFLLNFEQRF